MFRWLVGVLLAAVATTVLALAVINQSRTGSIGTGILMLMGLVAGVGAIGLLGRREWARRLLVALVCCQGGMTAVAAFQALARQDHQPLVRYGLEILISCLLLVGLSMASVKAEMRTGDAR